MTSKRADLNSLQVLISILRANQTGCLVRCFIPECMKREGEGWEEKR
jgi:hypothetical protein